MGMKISLDSESIITAIKEHITNQGISAAGKTMDVKLVISGRPAVATADVEFIDPNSLAGATETVSTEEKKAPAKDAAKAKDPVKVKDKVEPTSDTDTDTEKTEPLEGGESTNAGLFDED